MEQNEKKSYISSSDQLTISVALNSNDYGWEARTTPDKKVILTNPETLKDYGIMAYMSLFRGTGHTEWEVIMGMWMIDAIGEALETGNECDITIVFNTEFLAAPRKKGDDYRRFTKEQVYNHLIDKIFIIQEETDDKLKIAYKTE